MSEEVTFSPFTHGPETLFAGINKMGALIIPLYFYNLYNFFHAVIFKQFIICMGPFGKTFSYENTLAS